MGKQKINRLKISYDKEVDVFYLSVGSPKKAICQTLQNGVIIRRNPKDGKIIGLTIVDFEKHFKKAKPRPIQTNLAASFQAV